MPKPVKNINDIDIEIGNFQDKLKQFQKYLEINDIVYLGQNLRLDDRDEDTGEYQEKVHKEILTQIKMQDAILAWLPLLKKLKEDDATKGNAVRGGAEVGGMFAKASKE